MLIGMAVMFALPRAAGAQGVFAVGGVADPNVMGWKFDTSGFNIADYPGYDNFVVDVMVSVQMLNAVDLTPSNVDLALVPNGGSSAYNVALIDGYGSSFGLGPQSFSSAQIKFDSSLGAADAVDLAAGDIPLAGTYATSATIGTNVWPLGAGWNDDIGGAFWAVLSSSCRGNPDQDMLPLGIGEATMWFQLRRAQAPTQDPTPEPSALALLLGAAVAASQVLLRARKGA